MRSKPITAAQTHDHVTQIFSAKSSFDHSSLRDRNTNNEWIPHQLSTTHLTERVLISTSRMAASATFQLCAAIATVQNPTHFPFR